MSHQNTVEEDLLQIATQLKLDAEQIFQAFKIDMITIEATWATTLLALVVDHHKPTHTKITINHNSNIMNQVQE